MKILQDNSILKNLPQIKFEQFLILDSMRFTIEIIEINYNELLIELEQMSKTGNKNMPKTFNCVWNIVDNVQRLNEIYKKYPQDSELTLFKDIAEIKFFRHSYQHLEDRISEIVIDNKIPIFGAIKWGVNDNGKTFSCLAVSGNFYGNSMDIINPADCHNSPYISNITLITTVRQNKVTFEKELSISNLIDLLVDNVQKLENSLLLNNLELCDRKSVKDILLIFKPE